MYIFIYDTVLVKGFGSKRPLAVPSSWRRSNSRDSSGVQCFGMMILDVDSSGASLGMIISEVLVGS